MPHLPQTTVGQRGVVRRVPGISAILFACVAAALAHRSAQAQLPATRMQAAFPAGAQQGSEIDLTITSGADLEGVNRLLFSHAGITAVQKTQVAEGQTDATPVPNQFRVTVAPDVPVGIYEVRAAGTYGLSNPRAFVVGDRPEINEAEPNNVLDQAMEIALDSVVNGRSEPARDVDCFRFTAKAGTRLLVSCEAQGIDSRMDATLELYDPTGSLMAQSRDVDGLDPFLDATLPVDGEYRLKVYDFVFAGSAEHFYRLVAGTGPRIDFVLPPAGLPGTTATYSIFGRNLPGGVATEQTTGDGRPLERLDIEIALPAEEPAVSQFAWGKTVSPPAAFVDGVSYRLSSPVASSNAVNIALGSAPLVAEAEPNDSGDTAQPIAPPCEIYGQFQAVGDVDWFTFDAKKGDVLWFEVFAQRRELATDPTLKIERVVKDDKGNISTADITAQDDSGANIGGLQFATNSDDPVFRFAAPEDGTYRVGLADLYRDMQGDPRFVYRLSVRPETPDFRLVALAEYPINGVQAPNPWTAFVRKGGTTRLTMLAFRRDGFSGEIEVAVEGLPEGVTSPGATIGPGQTRTDVVIAAAESAADWAGTIRLTGRAKIGEADVVREVRGAAVTWPLAGIVAPARLTRDIGLSVGELAPFVVECGTSRETLPQGRQLAVPVKVTRRGDFDKPIALTAVALPDKVTNDSIVVDNQQAADPNGLNASGEVASHLPNQNQSHATLRLFFPQDAPLGTYTFYLQATAPVPFTKKPDGSDKKDVNVVEPSTSITVTIAPGPLTLAPDVPNKGEIKRGGQIEVPVKLTRRNEFAGGVKVDLLVPPGVAGLAADPVDVAADASEAKLVIRAAEDATEGSHAHIAIRATVEIDGKPVEIHQPIPLNVQK